MKKLIQKLQDKNLVIYLIFAAFLSIYLFSITMYTYTMMIMDMLL